MKPVTKGAWRFVRCLLLVACAGGVLAADNTWVGTFNLDFINPGYWLSSEASTDTADFSANVEVSREIAPKAEMSMGGLIHGLLFARPAGRWALDSRALATESSLGRRIVEFDQINPISGSDSFISYNAPASFSSMASLTGAVTTEGSASPASPSATTASGTWISNASGNWGNSANWQSGVIADGANEMARFDTLDITVNVTVNLDTPRTIGQLHLGDTNNTHRYTIAPVSGSALIFDSGSSAATLLRQSSTSAGDTISAPILLASNLDVFNSSTANPLTLSGSISPSTATFIQLAFRSGSVNVTGNITNGTGQLGVVVSGGTVTFSGTNTYTGGTSLSPFTSEPVVLLVNGNDSAATGTVFVSGDGSLLGGTGTVGGDVFMFGESTVTGATTGTVGALTMTQDLIMSSNEGEGGIYLANLSGATSDLLAIAGNLILGMGSALDIQGPGDGTTTYILATFADRNNTTFDMVSGVPGGYTLVYNNNDIELVPIPEPATWLSGALVLGALVFARRRRVRRS